MAGEPGVEVRRCRACGRASALLETAWEHHTNGSPAGYTTQEWRCQDCGKGFVIRNWMQLLGLTIAGVVLLPTCVGLPFLALAFWRWKQADWNPVVAGASVPSRRFRVGPLPRRCSCGGSAPVGATTAHVHNGLPTGTEYEHACLSCAARFTVESWWGMGFTTMAGMAAGGAGLALLLFVEGWGWKLGGLAIGAGGALAIAQSAWRLLNRLRYPSIVNANGTA